MTYADFSAAVLEYGRLYAAGMKKDANRLLDAAASSLEALPPDERDAILDTFVPALCDGEAYGFLFHRGDGEIPFRLKDPIIQWLEPRCVCGRMPHLRWCWQIFRNDFKYADDAYSCLQAAFRSPACDDKTRLMMFEFNIRALEYGAHELPVGLLISREEFDETVAECGEILTRTAVPAPLEGRYRDTVRTYRQYYGEAGGAGAAPSGIPEAKEGT